MPQFKTRMVVDPVDAFFSGFSSVFARMFLGGIAIVCGLVVGLFSGSGWGPFAIFGWAEHGAWFVLGLASLVSIFVGLWVFIHGSEGRRSFFFIFSVAALHFSSGLFPPDRLAALFWTTGIYGIATAFYWLVPQAIAAIISRRHPEEVETVAPIPGAEHPAETESAEPGAAPWEPGEEPTEPAGETFEPGAEFTDPPAESDGREA